MPMLRTLLPAAALALGLAAPASALVSLPTVERTLTAGDDSCATTSYTAKMAGFVTTRLVSPGGEWDLFLADAASGRTLSSSKAFGAKEVTQSFVDAGQVLQVEACRTAGSVSSVLVTIDFVDAVRPAQTTSSIIRTGYLEQRTFDALQSAGFDVTEMTRTKTFTDIYIPSAAKLAAFRKLGIPFKTRVADLEAKDAVARRAEARRASTGGPGLVPSGREEYRFLGDYQEEMRALAAAPENKGFIKPITIGETVQGREIQGLEFSSDVNAEDDGKPTFFLVANHHAREWPSSEIAMEYMHLLAQSYGKTTGDGPRVTNILDNARIVVVPVLNMDGFSASRGENPTGEPIPDAEDEIGTNGTAEGLTGTFAYRRKNCNSAIGNPVSSNEANQNLPCYYQTGVDPNRNYGFDWGGPGAGSSPTDQTYRGTGPWSEPETQAVWKLSQSRPVTVLVTMHTIAALVLRSPGLSANGLAPDEGLLKELGDNIQYRTGYKSQYGWQLYDTTGTTEDWNYGAVGALGYTIEIGPSGGDFHGDYKVAVENQWVGPKPNKATKIVGGGMKDALLLAAEYAFAPKTHSIINGTGTPGATLEVKKSFVTETSPVCVFAQGVIASAPAPADCAAAGAIPREGTPDGLTYTTKVKPDGTFRWHITQSTRPFEGFEAFDHDNKPTTVPVRRPTGTVEKWTLTCKATGAVREVVIDRGEELALGDVCAPAA